MEIKIDKEFKDLIPHIDYEEFLMLEESIKKEGCRDPITLWGDIILDGHNRYKICKAHGFVFHVKEIKIPSREEAILWIINNQLGRRNICKFDRILLEFKKKSLLTGELVTEWSRETRKEIAKSTGTSEGSIVRVKKIYETLSPYQIKEVREKIRKNEETINSTYHKLTKREKPEKKEPKKKITSLELAEWLHDQYEEISEKKKWKTQKQCQTKFKDLPKENREVMIELAKRLIKRFI